VLTVLIEILTGSYLMYGELEEKEALEFTKITLY